MSSKARLIAYLAWFWVQVFCGSLAVSNWLLPCKLRLAGQTSAFLSTAGGRASQEVEWLSVLLKLLLLVVYGCAADLLAVGVCSGSCHGPGLAVG